MAKKRRERIVGKLQGPPRESPNKGLINEWKRSGLDESIIARIEFLDTIHELTSDQLQRALTLFQQASEDKRWQELGEYALEPGHRLPLDDALRHLSVEEALAFLEQADLFDIAQRETMVSYVLSDRETPFYTLDELAVTTDKAVRYHERNRKYLLQYGHSLSDFGRCRFLWRFLCRLYYVRTPHRGYRVGARCVSPDLLAQLFPTGNLPEPGDFVSFWDENLDPITSVYDEWDMIEDIPLQDAARLEGAREKLYDLKLRTLKELARAARAHDADALWERVFGMIRETITAEEAEFYLRVDRIYEGYDVRTGELVDAEAGLIAGGLTALFEVVGHYEKEIRIGPLHHCKAALEAAGLAGVDDFGRGELRTSDGQRARSYFAFVKDRQRGALDAALDQFVAHPEEEARFRDEYRTRVNVALENELYEEITIRRKIRRSLAYKFEPHVSQLADWAKSCLEATGELPVVVEDRQGNDEAQTRARRSSADFDPAQRMDQDDTRFLLKCQEELAQFVSDGNLAGVLSVVAEDLIYWGGSLQWRIRAHAVRDLELCSGVFVSQWLARPILGAQQAHEMLEFAKGKEYAASFKLRFTALDEERRNFIDELVRRSGQDHVDTVAFLEAQWKGLYHMCGELSRYVSLLRSQIKTTSDGNVSHPHSGKPEYVSIPDLATHFAIPNSKIGAVRKRLERYRMTGTFGDRFYLEVQNRAKNQPRFLYDKNTPGLLEYLADLASGS